MFASDDPQLMLQLLESKADDMERCSHINKSLPYELVYIRIPKDHKFKLPHIFGAPTTLSTRL
jgi:hypothetical protein